MIVAVLDRWRALPRWRRRYPYGTVEATLQGLQMIPGSQSTFGWYEPHGFDDFCDSVTFAFDGGADSGSLCLSQCDHGSLGIANLALYPLSNWRLRVKGVRSPGYAT